MKKKLGSDPTNCKQQKAKLKRAIREGMGALEPPKAGYMARLLIQATMPHSKPKDLVHVRRNGNLTLEMIGHPRFGLPYGVYPRLLLFHVATEIVRTKSATVDLGGTISEFLRRLGLGRRGGPRGSITTLKDQAERLFRSSLIWTYERKDQGIAWEKPIYLVDERVLWWDPLKPAERSALDARVTLHPLLVAEILAHPIPLEVATIRELARLHGPFALDIYGWFAQRLFTLKEPLDLTWQQIQPQFGCTYTTLKNFAAAFLYNMRIVRRFYPAARIVEAPGGLTLWPSPPHVLPIALR